MAALAEVLSNQPNLSTIVVAMSRWGHPEGPRLHQRAEGSGVEASGVSREILLLRRENGFAQDDSPTEVSLVQTDRTLG